MIFCSQRPGAMKNRITRDSWYFAPSRSSSNARPAINGIARSREPIRQARTAFRKREHEDREDHHDQKEVRAALTCNVENLSTSAGTSGASCS